MDFLKQGIATLLITLLLGPCVAQSDLFDLPETSEQAAQVQQAPME